MDSIERNDFRIGGGNRIDQRKILGRCGIHCKVPNYSLFLGALDEGIHHISDSGEVEMAMCIHVLHIFSTNNDANNNNNNNNRIT